MAIYLPHLQHFDNMMNILRAAEQIGHRLTVDGFHAVLERLGPLGMIDGNAGMFWQTQNSLKTLQKTAGL